MIELFLSKGKDEQGRDDWRRVAQIDDAVDFARLAKRSCGAPGNAATVAISDLARAISAIFEVPVKVVGNGPDVVIDEF